MRLIEAKSLLKHFDDMQNYDRCACIFEDERGEPSTNWYCVEDAVRNAPTIDAIPVEWLTAQEYSENTELSVAANTVLKAWLTREQEA